MRSARAKLRRWHTWLGWLVGLPLLLWTLSGVLMVAKPIEEVRGEHLVSPPPPLRLTSYPVVPAIEGVPIKSLSLQQRADGPRWVIGLPDGNNRLADPATGALLPPLSAADAVREVAARYVGDASVTAANRTDPDKPPLDLRRNIAAWQVVMSDGTRFYVDSGSGEIVARRTDWWRLYDFMWGLHIMDLKTREDMHNPLVIGFGLLALVSTLLALALLPLTLRRRRRANGTE